MFLLKKLVSRLLFPLPFGLGLSLVGLLLLWFTARQKLGKSLVTVGVVLLLLLSAAPVAEKLLAPLEDVYLPYGVPATGAGSHDDVAFVVVLAGGLPTEPALPITRQVGARGMARLVEGVRVHRLCPNSKLVLSGGLGANPNTPRDELSNYRFVRLLGVDDEAIIIQNNSLDTAQDARNVHPVVGGAPCVLVTSASHLPRAMAIFQKEGMHPVPAPTDYYIGLVRVWTPASLYPSTGNLEMSERAIYEYLGTLWARLRGLV